MPGADDISSEEFEIFGNAITSLKESQPHISITSRSRLSHYIKAGGMKVKKAGEDFYFLQELAKQGSLLQTAETLVHPSPRISERVPFGTGRSVRFLLEGNTLADIPDQAFEILAQVLKSASDPAGFLDPDHPTALPDDPVCFFEKEKFPAVWHSILRNTPADHTSRLAAFHRWFDGLKTLRFLHAIQRELPELKK